MDTLDLLVDLIWEGKIEPLSPNQLALVNPEDIMIFDNDFTTGLNFDHTDISFDDKKTTEEFIFELQQEIIESEDDDESNQNWLDETITLPILADYIHPPQQRQPLLKIEQTALLLQEFDSVLDAVELTHLTPPQTPPESPQADNLNDLKLDQFMFTSTPQSQQPIILNSNFFNFDQHESVQSPACSQDIAHEMEVVEELVRSCAEKLPDWTTDDEDNSSESYSASSSPRSDDSFDNASQSNDDEWSPKSSSPISSATKKRARPYGRSTEDKKSKKKEQNKNAATRYRQKKKAETEVVLEEERELQEKNDKLQVKYADVQREIKYLKSLMRDLYRAKGLL